MVIQDFICIEIKTLTTIFIIIPWFHPAYKAGGPIQSIANMVEQFNDSISYKIFCSNTDLGGSILNVPTGIWTKYNENTQILYTSKNKQSIAVLKKQIKNCKADIIFITGIYSWYFNLVPLLFFNSSRKIVSARGMLHPGALSQKKIKKKIYLSLWKILGLHKKCDFHASNEEEKIYIENIFGKKVNIFISQNFPRIFNRQFPPDKKAGSLKLISVALISPMKNHLLVLEALKSCNEQIDYHIYGPVKENIYWQECLKQMNTLPLNISVKYYGDIPPHEVEKVLSNSHVFILPSKSENFGHAFYEALSAGKPIITSHNTPWNNLNESKAGINISIDKPIELIDSIKYFAAMDQNEFEEWCVGANRYAANSINVDDIKKQYQKMFFA